MSFLAYAGSEKGGKAVKELRPALRPLALGDLDSYLDELFFQMARLLFHSLCTLLKKGQYSWHSLCFYIKKVCVRC